MSIKNNFELEIKNALNFEKVDFQLNGLIKAIENFQGNRIELKDIKKREPSILDRYLSVGVLEILDKEEINMQLWIENNTNQLLIVSVIGAAKSILNNDNDLSSEQIELYTKQFNILLNNEKKMSHKYNQVGLDYTKNAQSLMYDIDKLLAKHEITKPSIEERRKKIEIEQKEKGVIFLIEKNENLSKEQFEERIKKLLYQEDSTEQINDTLNLIARFQQENIQKTVKKLKNPLDLNEKLLSVSTINPVEQKNAIIDWIWQDAKNREAINVSLMMIQNKIDEIISPEKNIYEKKFLNLLDIYEKISDTVNRLTSNKIGLDEAIVNYTNLKNEVLIVNDILSIRNKSIENNDINKINLDKKG